MNPEVIKLGSPNLRAELVKYSQSPEIKRQLFEDINPVHIIEKTRDNRPLTQREIFGLINGITSGGIKEGQTGSWLMAAFKRQPPLTIEETVNLTLAMAASGDVLNLDHLGIVADKHSSGGVGDKTTLVVAPIVAACGIKVGKMSGRGLSFSGGTLDKLESIPGIEPNTHFRVDLTRDEFLKQTEDIGIVVTGQTGDLAPADKILYALRDVTGTVPYIPFIASSIMSKKIASGSNHLVLDVKVGKGAFMKTIEEARELAKIMVDIGKSVGIKVKAEISNMDQPLGEAVGNSLEVLEAIQTLKGDGPSDFYEHCIDTSVQILMLAGKAKDMSEARQMAIETITNGQALDKFRAMVIAQGGDVQVVNDPTQILKFAQFYPVVYHGKDGFINCVNAETIGSAVVQLGGGREVPDAPIDHSVGIVMKQKIGNPIYDGDLLGYVYANDKTSAAQASLAITKAVTVGSERIEPPPHIHEIVE